jgi:sugar lactone lactonase YvrE
VYRLATDGTLTRFAGTGEFGFLGDEASAASAQLAWPIGLALDKPGNLYIADSANNRIRMVDSRGTITTVAGSYDVYDDSGDRGAAVNARLSFPFGVAVAPNGSLVIADTGNHRLRRVTDRVIYPLAGTGRGSFWGDNGPALHAGLSGPEGIAFDSKGNLYIADTENQRVRLVPKPL